LGKVFGHFDFWTFFLSIFENPKILCSKIFGKKNKLGKELKELNIYFGKQLKEPYYKIYFGKQLKEPIYKIYLKTT
jgi:hypothetical protein